MSDSYKTNHKEQIEAVEITSIQQSNNKTSPSQAGSDKTSPTLWAGLAILLLLVISVIFLLPKAVDDRSGSGASAIKRPQPAIAEPDANESVPNEKIPAAQASSSIDDNDEQEAAKAEVEELLVKLIEVEKNLKNHAVSKWAPEEYAHAMEQGRIGDEYFRQRQYKQASGQFRKAIVSLEVLEQRIQPTLEQALLNGEEALKLADQDAAMQQFELAQAIDRENIQAKHGLQRASTIKELFAIMQRASRFESHGQLQQALSGYQEAVALDPLSEEAESSLARVTAKLNDREFDQLIAAAYKALQNSQYSDAQSTFELANTIKPDSNEPELGMKKVADAIRQEKITNLLYEANHYIELQEWNNAANSFEQVLQLDSQHQQAQQGLKDSIAKAEIVIELKKALNSADELYKDEVLARAEALLRVIEQLESPGSIIENQYAQLSQLVHVAVTPVTISLESDGNTEVTVYRVARLGTFKRHQLQLRPGPYTVVGVRNGYRDKRINIQVSPDSSNMTILIRCDEPI